MILFPSLWRTLEEHQHVKHHLIFFSWDCNDTSSILTSIVCLVNKIDLVKWVDSESCHFDTRSHRSAETHTHMLQHRSTTESVCTISALMNWNACRFLVMSLKNSFNYTQEDFNHCAPRLFSAVVFD